MVDLSIGEVIEALRPSYQSIDVRVAAIKKNGVWTNLVSTIRFSYESVEKVKERQDEYRDIISGVSSNNFKILFSAQKIGDWDKLSGGLREGRISLEDIEINLEEKMDSMSKHAEIQYRWEPKDWALFKNRLKEYRLDNEPRKVLDSLKGEAKKRAYDDVFDLIRDILNISKNEYRQEESIDPFLIAPAYGKITHLNIDANTGDVEVDLKFHKKLNLQVNLTVSEPGSYGKERVDGKPAIELKLVPDVNENFLIGRAKANFTSLKSGREVRASLLYPLISSVELDYKREKVRGGMPFLKVLSRFCEISKFENQLMKPEEFKEKKIEIREQDIFERAVSWLLSMCGIPNIKLDECQYLRTTTGYEIISIDILGYKETEQIMFLVNCTTSMPESKEISKLASITKDKETLGLINQFKDVRISPIIFISRNATYGLYEEAKKQGVRVIDAQNIKDILNKLQESDIKSIESYFGPVSPY